MYYSPELIDETNRATYEMSRQSVHSALSAEQIGDNELEVLARELARRRGEDLTCLSASEQASKILGSAYKVLPETELEAKLDASKQSNTPLNIKYGIDPTGADVHLGHAVPMLLLDRFQRMGHKVTFIIGDFTAKIGDPTGRSAGRPVLTDEAIVENMHTYSEQVKPLFDTGSAESVHNSDWLSKYPLDKLIAILAQLQSSTVLQRNDFRTRLENGSGITMAELLYPVVMALDSVALKSDIEIGGRDQFLNMQMCRSVMEICGVTPEVTIATDILKGTDGSGAKMSKSSGNYVGLTHDPDEIYGRIMSIPDDLLEEYFKMLTEIEPSEWDLLQQRMQAKDVNPMRVKQLLASDIVTAIHDETEAQKASAKFTDRFSRRNYEATAVELAASDQSVVERVMSFRNEGKKALARLVIGGGVAIISPETGTAEKIADLSELDNLPPHTLLKVGKAVVRIM